MRDFLCQALKTELLQEHIEGMQHLDIGRELQRMTVSARTGQMVIDLRTYLLVTRHLLASPTQIAVTATARRNNAIQPLGLSERQIPGRQEHCGIGIVNVDMNGATAGPVLQIHKLDSQVGEDGSHRVIVLLRTGKQAATRIVSIP